MSVLYFIHDCQDSSDYGSAQTNDAEDLLTLFQINYQLGNQWIKDFLADEEAEVTCSPCERYELEKIDPKADDYRIEEIQQFDSLEWAIKLGFS